ncbi:MAG: OmpA family protein [Alphaproteobacteria bacterium]
MLADREAKRNDHRDAKRFMLRAEAAARSVTIWPLAVDAYDIKDPSTAEELEAARARLVLLFDGGRARAPAALARAHAAYECWLEEAEEGHQPVDLAWCRDRFIEAEQATRHNSGLDADWGMVVEGEGGHVGAVTLASGGSKSLLDKADAAGFVNEGEDVREASLTKRENSKISSDEMSMMPAAPTVFIAYFQSGSSFLDEVALQVIADAAADAADRPAPDIEILGFADRAGADATNILLSQARAAAVAAALLSEGAAEDNFLIYATGEDQPAIATPDGVAERRNRRVEIMVR